MKQFFDDIPLSTILLLTATLLAAQPAWCSELPFPDEPAINDEAGPAAVKALQQAAVYAGYRFISPADNPAAAAPYLRLRSGASGGFSAATAGTDFKLHTDAQFLHSDDYIASLLLDYSGLYRLSLDSRSLWHNLERLPTASIAPVPGQDLDIGNNYGVGTVITQANNRIKLGNNPVHLNLNYWQLTHEGTGQLRFSDFDFSSNFNLNGASARPVAIDSITREGAIGLDAHLGPVNTAYTFTIRDFSNQTPDSRDILAGFTVPQAHNVINDSRATTHTFKLFSDLSGGLTASALYSLSQRETATDRGDTRPSGAPVDKLQTVAGDLSYTPFNELSLNLKYRRLQIDRESPDRLSSPFFSSALLLKPATDSVKDTLTLSASYRPLPKAVYRFEYRAELETRDNLPDQQSPSGTARSDSRQTHTGKVNFIWKPLNALKLNATYSYSVTDNPAYPTSFGEQHSGRVLASYTASGSWGVTASYLGRFERGESISMETSLPRESLSNSVNASIWLSPMEQLTLNASYSYLQSDINQNNLFFNSFVMATPIRTAGAYRSTAHVYSLEAVAAITRMLDLSLALQQTFSDIRFSATDDSRVPAFSSTGIGDSSRLVSTETGLTSRADFHLGKHLGCSFGYSFRIYDAGQPLIDGAAHETLLALTGRW